jgi:hypothetical protein
LKNITVRKVIVRSAIVVFGLLCAAVISLCLFVGDPDPYQELDALSYRFDVDPSPEHLRDLLNYPVGSALSYYKMALVGASFSNHSGVFRAVSEDLKTDREINQIQMLATYGAGVFEYYPELKPSEFDERFSEQSWLGKQQGESGSGGGDGIAPITPPTPPDMRFSASGG